jgi:tetratricopeptide (TPR) repeat protein
MPSDDAALRARLKDENPFVRRYAEQALWVFWSRSGDDAIDALMETGVGQMQDRQLPAAIATFSEVIRRKPAFAEGWNKRATALFLAGELRKSLADCDEVVKRNPNHFGALAGYGQIYFQLEQYEKGDRILEAGAARQSEHGGRPGGHQERRGTAGRAPKGAGRHDLDGRRSVAALPLCFARFCFTLSFTILPISA